MKNNINELPSGNIDELRSLLDNLVEYDPNQIYDTALDYLSKVTNDDISVFDNTTPFSSLLGLNATMVSQAMKKMEKANNINLLTARNYKELNKFINYNDVKEVLALPASINFTIQIRIGTMVRNNIYQYKIPKYSIVRDNIHDYKYLIPHDIYIIRNRQSNIITVQYGNSYDYDSDLSDKIITTISNFNNGDEYIEFDIKLEQLEVVILDQSITTGNIDLVTDYNDQLYNVDVYISDGNKNIRKIPTFFTLDQVKNINDVAYIIDDPSNSKVNIGIHNNLIQRSIDNDQLSVIIKTTKGAIRVDYENFSIDDFSLDFRTEVEGSVEIHIFSNDHTIGGRNRLNFNELHKRIIEGRLGRNLPLTENNLFTYMNDNGLIAEKVRLNLSSREYLAASGGSVYLGLSDETVLVNIGVNNFKLDLSNMSNTSGIIIHPGVIQINKNTNFFIDNKNKLRLAATEENDIINQGGDNLTQLLNTHNAFYTPLYYMLYTNHSGTYVKAFSMDNPLIYKNRYVYTAYDETGIKVLGRNIEAIDNLGYKLQVTISPCVADKYNVYLKLKNSDGSKYKLYDITTDIDEVARTYEVIIKTDKTVLHNDKLVIENVINDQGMTTTSYIDLEGQFEIYVVDKLNTTYNDNKGMLLIADNLGSKIISKTKMSYILGKHLKWLWVDNKISPMEPIYDIVKEDVPLTYDTVVLDDANIDVNDCSVDFPILHEIGDPVLDDDNNPVLKYKAGDKRLDESGKPIILGYTGLQQSLNITVLDLVYRYSTLNINNTIIKNLEKQCTDNFEVYNKKLLGDTSINYTPRGQIGDLEVVINESTIRRLPRQPITVIVYIPKRNKPTDSLIKSLKDNIIKYVYLELSKQNVNLNSIGEKSRKGFEDIVSTINVQPVSTIIDEPVVVYKNNTISSKLHPLNTIIPLANGKYEVKPNIDIYINYI